MYDITFKCTYNLIEDEEESEMLYKVQYLQAFKLDEWDGTKINKGLNYITKLFKENDKGKQILKKMRDKLGLNSNNDTEVLFLFTYNYFYATHDCIIDLIKISDISEERFIKLMEIIENE